MNADVPRIDDPSGGGLNVGDVSGIGNIVGENINVGNLDINVVYETAQNYGLTLIDPTYFKDNQQTDENFESWKRGFPLKLPSVMKCLEFSREHVLKDIKDKLESTENNHRLLLLGRPGSSKSTVLMEIMCDYFENNYQIMYNWGNTKIENSEEVVRFIGQLLNNGNKILIAVDNIHLENAVGIFPIIDALTTHNKRENLRVLLTARIPDYDRLLDERMSKLPPDIRLSLTEIDNETFRYPLLDFTKEEVKEFIKRYQNEPQVKEFISKHSTSKIVNKQTYEKLAGIVSDKTKGDPIKIKFMVLGKGLAYDARMCYLDYLQGNEKKIRTTIFCSLLNMLNYVASKEALEVNDLLVAAQELADEFILEMSGGGYHTKHPSWDLELFSYFLNVTSIRTLQIRKEYLKSALNLLFKYRDEVLTSSIISAVFDMTTIETEEGKKIPIDVIDDVVVFPKYLSDHSRFILYGNDLTRCYYESGKYQKALDSTLKAIDIDHANAHAWYNKAIALGKLGRYEEEIVAYEKALELDPKSVDSWYNMGTVFGNLGEYEDAIAAFEKALEVDPRHVNAWYNKGTVLSNLGRQGDAIAAFEKALEFDPKNISPWYYKGLSFGSLERYEDAIAAFEKVLEVDPKHVGAWHNKGTVLSNLGRQGDAIAAFEKALEFDPKNVSAWYEKARCFARQNNINDALNNLEKAIKLGGEGYLKKAKEEKDFGGLRNNEQFLKLVNKAGNDMV